MGIWTYAADAEKVFADHLNAQMEAQGMTSEQLAQRVGCTRQTIHRYRSGKALPKVDLALRIAEALDIDVGLLLLGIQGPYDPSDCIKAIHDLIAKYQENTGQEVRADAE